VSDRRATAVEHLSVLLEQDIIELDVYKRLVDRILAATSDEQLGAALAAIPDEPPLVLRCIDGVVRERPIRVPPMTAITCEKGVMKVDLSGAEFALDVDLDVECDGGVLKVILPREVAVEVGGRSGEGGLSLNNFKRQPTDPVARVHVYLHNGGGVVNMTYQRRGLRFWRRAP
jgi:hypothetical protein